MQDLSMFPHVATLYNIRQEEDKATFTEKTYVYITIIKQCLLDASKASNVRASGLEGADAVNLYVPFDAEFVDWITGKRKQYIGPILFWAMSEAEREKYFTFTTGQDCFFVKGKAVPPEGTKPENVSDYINLAYDDVYNVTKVDIKDFGDLQHFEIGGA